MKELINFFKRPHNIDTPKIFMWLLFMAEHGIEKAQTYSELLIIKNTWMRRINDEFGMDRDCAWLFAGILDKWEARLRVIVGTNILRQINFQES